MRKLVAAAICSLSLSLSVTTGRKCIKEARTRTGKKCCEQQLRRVDKALSRAGDIPEGSWICLSHRNLILAEDKRCSMFLQFLAHAQTFDRGVALMSVIFSLCPNMSLLAGYGYTGFCQGNVNRTRRKTIQFPFRLHINIKRRIGICSYTLGITAPMQLITLNVKDAECDLFDVSMGIIHGKFNSGNIGHTH